MEVTKDRSDVVTGQTCRCVSGRQEFVCMAPGVMVTVGKSAKVLWVHGGKTEDNFICENQIMPQASYN